MTEYNRNILDCITALQQIDDAMFYEFCNDNITSDQFDRIKGYVDKLMYDLKNLN